MISGRPCPNTIGQIWAARLFPLAVLFCVVGWGDGKHSFWAPTETQMRSGVFQIGSTLTTATGAVVR